MSHSPCIISSILLVLDSKTSLMDPRFAPAWIAFAHTFALEGEHDHAVTAYSTCARMFTGYASPTYGIKANANPKLDLIFPCCSLAWSI